MYRNGATAEDADTPICCEPKSWMANGIFPVEYTDTTAGDPDPCFLETIERLWRAILAESTDQEAYRRYQYLPGAEFTVHDFVRRLSPAALRRFLSAAGIDWQTPPVEPTCDHDVCHDEWLNAISDWSLPRQQRLRIWAVMALGARVEGQTYWPVLEGARANVGAGRSALRRWPRPRPLPWEDGDGDAGR